MYVMKPCEYVNIVWERFYEIKPFWSTLILFGGKTSLLLKCSN